MKRLTLIALMTTAAISVSCRGGVSVDYGKSVGMKVSSAVESSRLYADIYSAKSGKRIKSSYVDPVQGQEGLFSKTVTMPAEACDVICYNFDMRNSFVSGESDESTLRIYTNDAGQTVRNLFSLASTDNVFHTPDAVALGISEDYIASDGAECRIAANDILEHWTLEVPAEGAQYISTVSALIGGMATEVYPRNPSRTVADGYVWTALSVSGDSVVGDFSTFGGRPSVKESLEISVVDVMGQPYRFEVKSDSIFSDARTGGELSIRLKDKILIPQPQNPGSGSGFNPTMGEWKKEEGEIII